ncbi:MAG: sigma-54-dependent Fis family transcriptional regulator [Proteobacteria bacterium]|nr:sigma-54-dependent Fis family transcriptional regulator [Pseudomonadota bacterium]
MANKETVLIADDDESIRWVLERFFTDLGYEVVQTGNGREASSALEAGEAALAILDINMPGRDGLQVLKSLPGAVTTPVIIMTAESSMTNTIEAMKLGAFDYVSKPFDLSELEIIVARAKEKRELQTRLTDLNKKLREREEGENSFIGKSKAMEQVFKAVGRAAPTNVAVLLTGESGTGKELLSRTIHSHSSRSEGPFIAVNSAAVPKELLESELFGHEKGAFTGATELKLGKFELADKGTLFLDEVGDMSLDLQARLLRVTQDGEFYRVGGKAPVKVDVRIVAATNIDMRRAVSEKKFREDLYHRLNGLTIKLPPLRDRDGDIALLADHFMHRFPEELKCDPKSLSPEALRALETNAWSGNVRELENVLRRALLLSPGTVITQEDLELPNSRKKQPSLEEIITERLRPVIERADHKQQHDLYDLCMPYMEGPLIRLVLEKVRGNQVQAAEVLGINRNTLRKKITTLDIDMKKIKGAQ